MTARRARRLVLPVVLSVAVASVVALAACGSRPMPVATEADAARAGTTVAELDRGRSLLLGHCGACHQPPSPSERTAAEWPTEVDEMAERSGLSPEDAARVTRYLTTFARDQRTGAPPPPTAK